MSAYDTSHEIIAIWAKWHINLTLKKLRKLLCQRSWHLFVLTSVGPSTLVVAATSALLPSPITQLVTGGFCFYIIKDGEFPKFYDLLPSLLRTDRLLDEELTPYEASTGRDANIGGIRILGCMAVCPIPKLKTDHKLAPTWEWLVFLRMIEDHEIKLLANFTIGKEANVTNHKQKWLNTWSKETSRLS